MKLKLLALAVGLATAGAVMASPSQADSSNVGKSADIMGVTVGTYAPYTLEMMGNDSPAVGSEMSILKNRQSGNLANQAIYFGGYARAIAGARFIKGSHHLGLGLSDVSLLATADINQWATVYMQLGAKNYNTSGSAILPDNIQVQQAYLLLGDLNKQPVYGFIGKKDIDFGYFGSVNPATSPINRSIFAASGNTMGIGYAQNGLNVVASAINGVKNDTNLLPATNNDKIDNFAINASYGSSMKNLNWNFGAGYINKEDYGFAGNASGAWDLNGQLSVDNFDVLAEYTASTKKVGLSTIKSWNIGADYNFPLMGRNSKVSLGYSAFKVSPASSSQYVVGFQNEFMPNIWGGISYSYVKGALALPGDIFAEQDGGKPGNAGTQPGGSSPASVSAHSNTIMLDLTAAF